MDRMGWRKVVRWIERKAKKWRLAWAAATTVWVCGCAPGDGGRGGGRRERGWNGTMEGEARDALGEGVRVRRVLACTVREGGEEWPE
jgi:hypothetical protein